MVIGVTKERLIHTGKIVLLIMFLFLNYKLFIGEVGRFGILVAQGHPNVIVTIPAKLSDLTIPYLVLLRR